MPDATVRIGQYCVAPYNEEWHRACITAVHNLVDVQVKLQIDVVQGAYKLPKDFCMR
jgi:hypothetical protein